MSTIQFLDRQVGRMGFGTMMMTWGQTTPQDQAFAAIKTALDNNMNILNSASFYGPPENPLASCKLLNAFFQQYPAYKDRAIVCVKGGMDFYGHKLSGDIDFLRRDLKEIQEALGGTKIDVYVIARQPDDVSVEQLMTNLKTLQGEGLFGGVALSEVKASTIRKAHAVHPVVAVENELSLFCLEDGIRESLKTCDELGIAYTAYSPLGRGMLTGRYKSLDEIPKDDIRHRMPRFQGDNFAKNIQLAKKVEELANSKGISSAQLALAYIMRLSKVVVPLQASSNAERIISNGEAVNVKLTDQDVAEIDKLLASIELAGGRTHAVGEAMAMK